MSWLLAFLGFSVLIILHEFGHFAVAKAVGMRVERFSLFFPPLIWRRQGRGETEYAVGAVPLGGYVKISGMNPHEELPPEHAHRAYFRQPVWKRIAVIAAGPMVNIVLAGVILTGLVLHNGKPVDGAQVVAVQKGKPAWNVLEQGDRIISVDGRTGDADFLSKQIDRHRCAGKPVNGCVAATPARLVVQSGNDRFVATVRPRYDGRKGVERMLLGFTRTIPTKPVSLFPAAGAAADEMWRITSTTVTTIGKVFFSAKDRSQVSGIVGTYEATRQAVKFSAERAIYILALISLSLGVINLFPFLPLDGGHIFWALAEKVRGRAIPFSVMERAGFVGFALVAVLFVIGFTNDIGRLTGEGFGVGR